MAEPARLTVRLGGGVWQAPAGSLALASAPVRRLLPGGGWLALQAGRAVPALDPGGLIDAAPLVWLMVPGGAGGAVLLAVEAVLEPATDALEAVPPLPAAWLRPAAVPALPAPAAGPAALPSPALANARPAAGLPRWLAVQRGAVRLVLASATVERILPWAAKAAVGGQALSPVPGLPAGGLGYRIAGGAPALLLDPAWCSAGIAWGAAGGSSEATEGRSAGPGVAARGEQGVGRPAGRGLAAPSDPAAEPKPPEWLVLFNHAGRRFGLPADRVTAVDVPAGAFTARLGAADAAALLGAAPAARDEPPAPPEPQRVLLLCRAGGQGFALAVEDVAALLPAQLPAPAPGGASDAAGAVCGICQHRGAVLPVLDAGRWIGGAAVLRGGPVPLVRLLGARPVALAVARIGGLIRVPARAVTPVGEAGVGEAWGGQADGAGFGAVGADAMHFGAAGAAGLVAEIARIGDAALPVLRAGALLAAAGGPGR